MAKLVCLTLLALCAVQVATALPHHRLETQQQQQHQQQDGEDSLAEAVTAAEKAKADALQDLQDAKDAVASGDGAAASAAALKAIQAGLKAAERVGSATDIATGLAEETLSDAVTRLNADLSIGSANASYQVWYTTESLIVQLDQVGVAVVFKNSGMFDEVDQVSADARKDSTRFADEASQVFNVSLGTVSVQATEVLSEGRSRMQTFAGQLELARRAALDGLDAAIQAAAEAKVDGNATSDARDELSQQKTSVFEAAEAALSSLSGVYGDAVTESLTAARCAIKKSLEKVLENITLFVESEDITPFVKILRQIQAFSDEARQDIDTATDQAASKAEEVIADFLTTRTRRGIK